MSHEEQLARRKLIWREVEVVILSLRMMLQRGAHDRRLYNMPLHMDHHKNLEGLTIEAVAGAHQRDLETQGKCGAEILRYWCDEENGEVFCLFDAPSAEAAEAVHPDAHGLMADEIIEVEEGY
jgi:Nickel responsive protein SCO4226-like